MQRWVPALTVIRTKGYSYQDAIVINLPAPGIRIETGLVIHRVCGQLNRSMLDVVIVGRGML